MSRVGIHHVNHHYVRYISPIRNSFLKEVNHRDNMPDIDSGWTYCLSGVYMNHIHYVRAFYQNMVWGMTFPNCWKYDLRCNRGTDRPSTGMQFRRCLQYE